MKPKPLLITLAAVSALAASAANAAQIVVSTGAGYVKMVDALAALYQKETGVAVEKSFGGNIGQMLAQVKHDSGVNVVISDEASLEKCHDRPLYTSDAGDDLLCVDLGGRRIIKKKNVSY